MAQQTLPKVSTLWVNTERCDLICPSLPLLSKSERRGLHGSADTSRWKAWARGTLFSLSLYDHVVLNTLDLFIQPGWDSHWQDHTRAMEKCHGTRTEACLVASYLDLKQLNRYHSHRCNWNRSFTSLRLVRLAESNFGSCLPKGRICHLHTSLRWSHSRKVQVIQLSFILCEV